MTQKVQCNKKTSFLNSDSQPALDSKIPLVLKFPIQIQNAVNDFHFEDPGVCEKKKN